MDMDPRTAPFLEPIGLAAHIRAQIMVLDLPLTGERIIGADSLLTKVEDKKETVNQFLYRMMHMVSLVIVIEDQGLQNRRAKALLKRAQYLLLAKMLLLFLQFIVVYITKLISSRTMRMLSSSS